jgi:hypothetical protein
MDAEAALPWVTVASYFGLNAEVEADLAVANLQGSAIPVERLPKQPLGMFVTKLIVPAIMPIQVMVPADRESEARELLDEQPSPAIPPKVRSVVRWFLAVVVVSGVVNGPLSRQFHDIRGLAAIALGLTMLVGLKLVISELGLAAAIQRERPTRPGAVLVLATILLFGGAGFLLLYPLGAFGYDKTHAPSHEAVAIAALVGYTLLAALLLRQSRRGRETEETDETELRED